MTIVVLPDGRKARFPDDMPREQMKAYIDGKQQPQTIEEARARSNAPEWMKKIADRMVAEGRTEMTAGEKAEAIFRGALGGASDLGGRQLNAATLGASDWVTRKAGVNPMRGIEEMLDSTKSDKVAGLIGVASGLNEMVGAFPIGSAIYKGTGKLLSSVPKAGKYLKYFTPVLSGAITGGAYGGFQGDSAEAIGRGAARGAFFGLAADAVGRGINAGFSAMQKIKGVPRGLPNVVQNDEGTQVLDRAVKESKKIAKEVYGQAPAAKEQVNQKMAGELDNAIGRRIDIGKTHALQEQKYADFMNKEGDRILLNNTQNASRYVEPSGQYEPILKSIRRHMQKVDPNFQLATKDGKIDYGHFLKDAQRREYIGTLPSTYKNPSETFNGLNNGEQRSYLYSQYKNPQNDARVHDLIIKSEDGTVINKFAREGLKGQKYVDTLKTGVERRTSVGSPTLKQAQTGNTPSPNLRHDYNIPQNNEVVNPNVERLYSGLNTYQKNALDTALKTGKEMTTSRFGSLNHINETKKVLNDMIEKSKNQTFAGSKATNETVNLNSVKKRIDGLLGDSGTKALDKSYSKVYRLQDAYEQGATFNQNNLAKQPDFKTIMEKRAFAEGLKDKIINNASNKNIANEVLKNQDALKRVLPDKSFKKLIEAAKENNLSYDRLSTLASKAGKTTGAAEPISKNTGFIREILETLGSVAGGTIDIAKRAIIADSASRAANYLLNPNLPAKQPLYDTIQQYLPSSAVILKESKTKRKEKK